MTFNAFLAFAALTSYEMLKLYRYNGLWLDCQAISNFIIDCHVNIFALQRHCDRKWNCIWRVINRIRLSSYSNYETIVRPERSRRGALPSTVKNCASFRGATICLA